MHHSRADPFPKHASKRTLPMLNHLSAKIQHQGSAARRTSAATVERWRSREYGRRERNSSGRSGTILAGGRAWIREAFAAIDWTSQSRLADGTRGPTETTLDRT